MKYLCLIIPEELRSHSFPSAIFYADDSFLLKVYVYHLLLKELLCLLLFVFSIKETE
jgi:hypothetical protein